MQMDLEKLVNDGVDLEVYDNLEISFNDGSGLLTSTSGEQVQFGETISRSLSIPLAVAGEE